MKIEQSKYTSGDPEKMKKAMERKKAIEEGRLPQWEAEQVALAQSKQPLIEKKVETPEERMKKLREGDPEKAAALRAKLQKLYPGARDNSGNQ
jgi:pyruvate/2-oxoacid:ferredoxin oxidoreductase beta subunit